MGHDTINFVRALEPEVEDGSRVLIGFKLSDIHPHLFYYETGQREGQPGVSMRGRLIGIDWARVNGVDFNKLQEAE